jgi:DNA repair protein RadC
MLMIGKDTMKCLPELDRPYERIEKYGTNTLTDSELLAVIIKTGTKNKKAIDVAREVLNRFHGDVSAVCNAGLKELTEIDGIGRVKALQIKAAGELGVRLSDRRIQKGISAKNYSVIGLKLSHDIGSFSQEIFRILMLNSRFRVIREKDISVGILDAAIIHPREVFSEAVKERCAYVVLVHNHPSGDAIPGNDDFSSTEKIAAAGMIIGIPVFDHIVVSHDNYYSMREQGDMTRIEMNLKKRRF